MEVDSCDIEQLVARGIATKKQVDGQCVYWIPDDDIRDLRRHIKTLQQELRGCGGSDVDIEQVRKEQIQRLHEYNELKDATAVLLGKLAEIQQCTLATIYERYQLTTTE